MDKTKQLTTTAMMVALAAVLALIIFIIPMLQGVIIIIAIPMIVVGVKFDLKTHGLALLALGIILLTLDPLYAITVMLLIGPLSLVQGYFLQKKKQTSEIIFVGSIAMIFGVLAMFYMINIMLDINIMEDLKLYTTQVVDEVKSVYSSTTILPEEDLNTYLDGLEQLKSFITLLMPSFIAYYAFFSSVLCFAFTKAVFKRIKIPVQKSYFKDFRIDHHKRTTLMIVMLVVTAAAMFDKGNMDYYILNLMSVLFLVFQINGMALIWHLTDKHPNKKALRVIVIVLYIVSPMIAIAEMIARYGLGIVGFLDMYVDFRKRMSRKEQ